MRKIVIIDDNYEIIRSIKDNFSNSSYEFHSFTNASRALQQLEKIKPELILLDLIMPQINGFEFLHKAKTLEISIPIVIISGENKIDTAVKAIKLGASDYVTKPFNFDLLEKTITQYLNIKTINRNKYNSPEIIGKSSKINQVMRDIEKSACSYDTTILISGETGTGKELVARSIHFQSSRKDNPFIEINCSAMQETLLESELFGYEKGAFTGADIKKKGLLEIADTGTFFLDEIGDMPISLQTKLLKVLEQKKFRRIGGIEEISVDVRFLCATSQNLEEKIKSREFREDLYYRINVVNINLPSLRSRKDDILLLAGHFLAYYNQKFNKNIKQFGNEAIKMLLHYSWPGNIRELKNKVERAVLFEENNTIKAENLQIYVNEESDDCTSSTMPSGNLSLDQLEKQLIIKTLRKTNGNQIKAAEMLKITRQKIRHRIEKYRIDIKKIKMAK